MEHILKLFGLVNISSVTELKAGHINKTYLVECNDEKYILQSLNRKVFEFPEMVMNNISAIEMIFYRLTDSCADIPHFLKSGEKNYVESAGEIWRLYPYIPSEESDDRAYFSGCAAGAFIRGINSADIRLKCTIPYFHDFDAYFKRLKLLDINGNAMTHFEILSRRLSEAFAEVPKRNIHGDAKVSNIIQGKNRKMTVIDLDTAMYHYAAIDYGDLIRSIVKNEKFNDSSFTLATKGFSEGLDGFLTGAEVDSLYYGILWVTAELSMRYYLDSVLNFGYFGFNNPERSMQRANELLKQLILFEENENYIIRVIKNCFK